MGQLVTKFKQEGLHLPIPTQEKLKELKKELTRHELAFRTNIAQAQVTIQVKLQDLAGLSDEYIATLKKTETGDYILGIDRPTVNHILGNCSVESTRKALWKKSENRGYPENMHELQKIIALRDEIAKLLGYDSYAALTIDGETARDVPTVEKFLADLAERSKIKENKEFKDLVKVLPAGVTLTSDGKIKPWDLLYLENHHKRTYFQVDELEIAHYFPFNSALAALFDISKILWSYL